MLSLQSKQSLIFLQPACIMGFKAPTPKNNALNVFASNPRQYNTALGGLKAIS
jgi:hypothetical protein